MPFTAAERMRQYQKRLRESEKAWENKRKTTKTTKISYDQYPA